MRYIKPQEMPVLSLWMDIFHYGEKKECKSDGRWEGELDGGRKEFTFARTDVAGGIIWSHLLRCTCAASAWREKKRESEREREMHPLLSGNSCASATAAVWHFRWPRFPLYSPLELTQTTMASHQKRRQENQILLSDAVEISVQTGKGGMRPLASLPCQPAFYYAKHSHTHTHTVFG